MKKVSPAKVLLAIITIMLLCLVVYILPGCEVFKHKSRLSSDSTSVKHTTTAIVDTSSGGSVKREERNTHEESEWFRMTLQYLANQKPAGDTTINNYYPQPATVIYEGGKGKRDENVQTIDSSFYINILRMMAAQTDSFSRKLDQVEKNKHTETKGIGFITLLLSCAGILAVIFIFRILARYKISKR